MDARNIKILFWDDKNNFDLEQTQIDLGIFEGKSGVYKDVFRFFDITGINSVLENVGDEEPVFILCHIHTKGLTGYKKFQTLLKEYPNFKNYSLYVSSNREAHKHFFDDTGNNDRIFTYSSATKEIENLANIPTKKELLKSGSIVDMQTDSKNILNTNVESTEKKSHPIKIAEGIKNFEIDYNGKKTAFIMTSFSANHTSIIKKIKETLKNNDVEGLVANDKEYEEDLFPNIQVYMHCCDFGIGVFSKIDNKNEFNPNLSLEVGYMMGLGKDVCYFKEKQCPTLNTDLLSKLYKEFDAYNIDSTLPNAIEKWLKDKGLKKD